MIIESAELRSFISHKLANENIRVLEAEYGRQALELLQVNNIDFILLDLSMAEVDGFDFLTTINRYVAGTKIPIIVFSSKNLTSVEQVNINREIEINIPKGKGEIEYIIKEIKKVLI